MKKLILVLLGIAIVSSVAFAYPIATGEVSDVPAFGLFKRSLDANQIKGSIAVIGGNIFQYVLNTSTEAKNQSEPAFWSWASMESDGYSVKNYASSADYMAFAGIWVSDIYGATSIGSSEGGWILIKGICDAYVSGEGTNIAIGDILAGSTLGQRLKRDHAAYTSNTPTSSFEVSVLSSPKALEAKTDASGLGLITVLLD